MYKEHLKSLVEERLWLFQLKYVPFNSGEWILILLPLFWLLSLPILLIKSIGGVFEDKNMLSKVVIVGLYASLVGLFAYIYLVLGNPNQEKWKSIFKKHIDNIAVKVYDDSNNMIGGISKNGNKGKFYVEYIPPLYWNILKFREEHYLSFDNNRTDILGLIKNPRSFNGVDVLGIPFAIIRGRGGSSLSQQLVKNFYGQDYFEHITPFHKLNTVIRKLTELSEAKTFYHNLKDNNGEEFKRWITMYPPSLVSNGSVYGIESVSAVVFGKKPKDLTEAEQVILSEMYKYNYYFFGKPNKIKCKKIKKGAKIDIKTYFKNDTAKKEKLIKEVNNWQCPKEPRVPLTFYQKMKQQDIRGKALYGNPNNRIWEWASTSGVVLKYDLKEYQKEHNNSLITEAKMSVDVGKNILFKHNIDKALKGIENRLKNRLIVDLDGNTTTNKPQANIWVSVVNDKGEIKYIYKRGNTSYKRRIGSISKIFETIALGNRGDKWNYYYCNEYFHGLHNSDGSVGGECKNGSDENIYSAREVIGASKNLPLMSAFKKYIVKNRSSIKIYDKEVNRATLEKIYKSFNLSRDNKTTMEYELSFGLVNSTPYNLQKAIHKLSHLLYSRNNFYNEAHIAKYIKYKIIKDYKLINGGIKRDIYKRKISDDTRAMFDKNTKIYMQTVLKAPLNNKYGTLKSFRTIQGFKPLFIKSGTTDKKINGKTYTQSKWVAGAIKVKGKRYSFVIMVDREQGIGKKLKHFEITKPIFKEIVNILKGKEIKNDIEPFSKKSKQHDPELLGNEFKI